jgi:hypothetical protein
MAASTSFSNLPFLDFLFDKLVLDQVREDFLLGFPQFPLLLCGKGGFFQLVKETGSGLLQFRESDHFVVDQGYDPFHDLAPGAARGKEEKTRQQKKDNMGKIKQNALPKTGAKNRFQALLTFRPWVAF